MTSFRSEAACRISIGPAMIAASAATGTRTPHTSQTMNGADPADSANWPPNPAAPKFSTPSSNQDRSAVNAPSHPSSAPTTTPPIENPATMYHGSFSKTSLCRHQKRMIAGRIAEPITSAIAPLFASSETRTSRPPSARIDRTPPGRVQRASGSKIVAAWLISRSTGVSPVISRRFSVSGPPQYPQKRSASVDLPHVGHVVVPTAAAVAVNAWLVLAASVGSSLSRAWSGFWPAGALSTSTSSLVEKSSTSSDASPVAGGTWISTWSEASYGSGAVASLSW